RITVLADHSKFDRSARYRTLPHSAIATIITDQKPAPDILTAIEGAGAEVLYPPQNPS
ncbi:MAG: DeoR/GlpR transcriptional regulator, partial [Mesorhizobium sp.]